MGDDPTFDLTLEDRSAADVRLVLSGLSLAAMQAARAQPEKADRAEGLLEDFMRENRDAVRALMLEATGQEVEFIARVDDDLKEHLGIDVVDGEVIDAR